MAVYFALNAQNRAAPVPVQTWQDKLYVLFAMDYRDLADDAHRVVSQIVHPAFQLKRQDPLAEDVSISEALRDRFRLIEPDITQSSSLLLGCTRNRSVFELEWNRWSDLIDFKFWGNLLAYVVHSIALKIWDVCGASQKVDETTRLHGDMLSSLFLTRVKLGSPSNNELFVSLSLTPVNRKLLPVLSFHLHIPGERGLYFKADRFWNHGEQMFLERMPAQGDVAQPLKESGLFVTFDRSDRTERAQHFQMKTAVELMVKEKIDRLIITPPDGLDFSVVGFERDPKGYWTIDRKQVDEFKIQSKDSMTWKEWVEQEQIMEEIPADRAFFPDGYLLPQAQP